MQLLTHPAGDVITAQLPMVIRAETVQDNRPQFQSLAVRPMLSTFCSAQDLAEVVFSG